MNNSIRDIITSVLKEAGHSEFQIPAGIKVAKKDVHAWITNEDGKAYINFNYKSEFYDRPYKTNLRGTHQALNCAYALEVFRHLNEKGFNITREHIDNGFVKVPLNGRFETINKKPLVIFDTAENTDDVRNFVNCVNEYFGRSMQKALATPQNLHPKPFKKLIIFDCGFGLDELTRIKQNVTIIFTNEQIQKKYLSIYDGVVKTLVLKLDKAIAHATKNFSEYKILILGKEDIYQETRNMLCIDS